MTGPAPPPPDAYRKVPADAVFRGGFEVYSRHVSASAGDGRLFAFAAAEWAADAVIRALSRDRRDRYEPGVWY